MYFDWDAQKNEETQNKHGISFEEIVTLIARGGFIKSVKSQSDKYQGQKIMLVRKGKAIYLVPYETRGEKHWLITAFYSEKFTRKYTGRK